MKSFCPLSRQYAVIQMDPVGMVKHFDDPIALAAAQAMRPKKYLVYLDHAIDLPSLTNPWFRYKVSPIATTLRPEDSEAGITSDMVIPIYPNTYHPSGYREPIHTHPTFPFPNCFHWIKNTLTIRVRRMATRYDDTNAYKVTFFQHLEIDKAFWPDQLRATAFLQAKRAALEDAATPRDAAGPELRRSSLDSSPESRLSVSDVESYDSDDKDSLPDGPEEPVDTDDTDPSASRPATHSVDAAMNSLEALFKMNIFGFEVDDTAELMPLVDLWFELTDHLTAKTIPSPTELYEEHEEIMRSAAIVERGTPQLTLYLQDHP
ncbi:hypothetical protein FKP32DRAFT_1563702 [Trametes sanguinea]|nr:hypothetical protein FKP32DRAFT_1563702 [Trametes sanguinea]